MKSPDIACIQMATSLWLFSWFAEVKLILCGQQYISTNRPGSIAGIACRAEVDRAVGLLKRESVCWWGLGCGVIMESRLPCLITVVSFAYFPLSVKYVSYSCLSHNALC